MRGIETGKTRIRHSVFTEIARLAYEESDNYAERLEEMAYKICPGDPDGEGSYMNSLILERAVIGERLRMAMGLPMRKLGEYNNISDGVTDVVTAERYYEPPLINVIKFACNKCREDEVIVTELCRGCLEHPCVEVCPRQAISKSGSKSNIDPERCIRCDKCLNSCAYHAIVHQKRPCSNACGIGCISSDEHGRAQIDYSKCTSCGQCMVSCPFGAISDKSQIFQTIRAIKSDTPVYAAIAPSFAGQFGSSATPARLRTAFRRLGFADMIEVGIGADLCVIEEAADFLYEVPAKHSFMVTSCCPSWSDLVKKMFPQFEKNISVALTPMVLTARMIKSDHPGCKVCFVGPCDSKKLEAQRKSIRSDVDFVLTFEETLGMFEAKGLLDEFDTMQESEPVDASSHDARMFAVSGGVAQAVVNAIHDMDPAREVKIAKAAGLKECRKLLLKAKAGLYDGYLLEGMACPNGCISGAGTLRQPDQSEQAVRVHSEEACFSCANNTEYRRYLPLINEKNK